MQLERSADLRYRGQGFEINVPFRLVAGRFPPSHNSAMGMAIPNER